MDGGSFLNTFTDAAVDISEAERFSLVRRMQFRSYFGQAIAHTTGMEAEFERGIEFTAVLSHS